jgi:uncharacterized ParB-like nuclease family protein
MTTIKMRRGTAAAWTAANTVLAAGEAGLETDTGKLKYGNGVTAWNALGYFLPAAADIPLLAEYIRDTIAAALVAGANVTITPNDGADTITIAATGGGGGGGLADGSYGDVTVSGSGTVITINNASVTLAKMANMATGSVLARTTAGAGAPEVISFAALKGAMAFVKGDVGLGNVDNTSDANKPISTATQTALDGKAATAHNHASTSITDFAEAVDDRVATLLVAGANVTLTYNDAANTLTIASTGGGGGGMGDGDYGDITISGTSTVMTIDPGAVTLAKMANLAQDQFIGRVSASTGVPETTTITAAARTVLDDTTVAAMVNTLGGAASTGTGGLVRTTGATLSAPTLSGIRTTDGAEVTTANAMGALAIDVTKMLNTKSIAADSTFTFSGTPAASDQWFGMYLTNTDTNPHTVTIPSSFSVGRQAAITSFVIPASGEVWLIWRYNGTGYKLFGETPYLHKFDATAAPTANDDITDGYGPGSLWLNATGNVAYICESNAAAAAVWHSLGGGGGLTDGDKGDITVGGSGTTLTIDADAVTFAKMQNIATDRLLGRDSASSGDVEEITVGGGLEFTGSGGVQRSALTGDVTAAAGNNATTISNGAVTLAKMANLAQDQAIGRVTASTGVPETFTVTAAARTVLDDTSVAAMVDTLGGAASSGSGGLARATGATLVGPIEQLAATPGTDDTYQGQVITGRNWGATVAQWDAVYLDSAGTWQLADANGSNTFPCRGLAAAAGTAGNPGTVLDNGVARNDAWAWTVGGDVYLSETAGGLTQTAPSASGSRVQKIGYALTADSIRVNVGSGEIITLT